MRTCLTVAAVALALALSNRHASAQRSRPPREARSENGRYVLRIRPGRTTRRSTGTCQAVLFERGVPHQRRRTVWRGPLVNRIAPRYVFVRNDGRFVVTLDEFRRGGTAHALVIYDHAGKPVREFGLRELLRGNDWKHVRIRGRAVRWLAGATLAFDDPRAQFVIRLKWRRTIRVDLQRLRIVPDDATATSGDTSAGIPPEILALLEQPTSGPAASAPAASAPPTSPATQPADAAVEQALARLRWLAAVAGVSSGLPQASPGRGGRQAGDPDATVPAASSAPAVSVPRPDPAHPVNYLGWMLQQTETEGPGAAPLYRAAFDAHVEWEGDDELWRQALRGDPDALASPEVAACLEANRAALANLRAAVGLDYRGDLLPSEDGTVLGVLLPSLGKTRELVQTAIIAGRLRQQQGDVEGALEIYADMLAVGAQSSSGPTLIENLVGTAVQELTADALLDAFASRDDEIDYERVVDLLAEKYRPCRPLADALQAERAMAYDVIQRCYEWNPETGRYDVSLEGIELLTGALEPTQGDPVAELTLAATMGSVGFEPILEQVDEYYDRLTQAAVLPYPQATRALDDLEADISAPALRAQNPVLATMLPSVSRCKHLATRGETARRGTLLVARLKAYRQQHGTYPDSLAVFDGSPVVIDPYTGHRFVYRRGGDDFVLYSLGGNGTDDGGIHDRRADTNDYVFWPRPAAPKP